MKLYEMSAEWQEVFDMLADPEIPEEAVYDTIEMIEADMDTKSDSYAKIIKSMAGDVATLDAEIKRLQERKSAMVRRSEWLKSQLEAVMRVTGRTKFKTALFTYNIQKNGGVRPVEFTGDVPREWLKPGEPDTKRIREHLETFGELPFAKFGERGESLRIR